MLSQENDPSRTNSPNTWTHRVGSFDCLLATTCRSRCGIDPIGLPSSYPLDLPWRLPFLGVALGVRREAPGCEVGARRQMPGRPARMRPVRHLRHPLGSVRSSKAKLNGKFRCRISPSKCNMETIPWDLPMPCFQSQGVTVVTCFLGLARLGALSSPCLGEISQVGTGNWPRAITSVHIVWARTTPSVWARSLVSRGDFPYARSLWTLTQTVQIGPW